MQEDVLIGRQLANYAIERVIGRGGMAVVYFARDVRLNRPAAIKVIDSRFRDNPNYTGRFLQEAKLVAAWRHEHILQIYYADDEQLDDLGRLFFFAMEYIDGQNLAEVLAETIKQHGSVPLADVLRYGRAIAAALDYAHQRGVIHRDVKPANVLVSGDGRVVLSDFGLALDVQQGSIGEVFGSAHYIAPEQARRSRDAVAQSDLYSLGVILYEMLTGAVPFDDPSPTSVALQHITLPPPRPREINPELSQEVEAVLLKALAKSPAERYASGAELMAAVEAALVRMSPSVPTRKKIPLPAVTLPGTAAAPIALPVDGKLQPGRVSPRLLIAIGLGAAALFVCAFAAIALWAWRGASQADASTPTTVAMISSAPLSPAEATAVGGAVLPPAAAEELTQEPAAPTLATSEPAAPTAPPPPAEAPAALATETPAPQPTLTWTPRYAAGRKMILSWNDSSFYMLQVSGYGELIDPVAFERLNAEGFPTNRFSGKQWAELHASTLRDWCMRLELGGSSQPASAPEGLPPFLRPAPCEQHYLATRWPEQSDPSVFWTRQEGSRQFRVLWGREEIQRCDIDAGTCEVYLP